MRAALSTVTSIISNECYCSFDAIILNQAHRCRSAGPQAGWLAPGAAVLDHLSDNAHHLEIRLLHLPEMLQRPFQRVLAERLQCGLALTVDLGVRAFDPAEMLQALQLTVALAVVPAPEAAVTLAGKLRQVVPLVAQQVVVDDELERKLIELASSTPARNAEAAVLSRITPASWCSVPMACTACWVV